MKHPKLSPVQPIAVRTRRAYFDCKFGQLHVRTAFPTTGGFDEQVTLFCLHPSEGSSRTFDRLLPEIADERSVYAPDLPGFGESDAASRLTSADAAGAMSDLANDLRLRQIDVLGVRYGAAVAVELAAARPDSGAPFGPGRYAAARSHASRQAGDFGAADPTGSGRWFMGQGRTAQRAFRRVHRLCGRPF